MPMEVYKLHCYVYNLNSLLDCKECRKKPQKHGDKHSTYALVEMIMHIPFGKLLL